MHELGKNENRQKGQMDCCLDIDIFFCFIFWLMTFSRLLVFFCMHHQYSWRVIYKVLFYNKRQVF